MIEMMPTLPPNLDTTLNQFYAVTQPDPAFAARLEAKLRQRHEEMISSEKKSRFPRLSMQRSFMQTLRTHPILALFLAILALLVLTGMVYALSRLTGFIPGFGFTSDGSSVYVLAEPMERTSGSITLNVNQAVNDGERFWVELTANGLSERGDFASAFILLPDGKKIQSTIGGSVDLIDGGARLSFLFPPITGQPNEVALLVEGLGGQDFDLILILRPVKGGEIVPAPLEGTTRMQSEAHNGVRLVLDHVAVDSSKTVFQASLHYDQPDTWVGGPWGVTLSDASGALYPLTNITPDTMTSGDTYVYQTVPFTGDEQLVLTLVTFPPSDTLPMFMDFSGNSPAFTFDPGANPHEGQRWELNQPLSAGGFDLKVVSSTLIGKSSLSFEMEPGPSVTGVMFTSNDPLVSGLSGGVPAPGGNIKAEMTFSRFPEHPFDVRLMRIYYKAKGSWQIHWQPPAAPTAGAPTPTRTTAPTLPQLPTSTLATSDPILLEVQQLAQKFDAPFQQGPGWVHVVKETITHPQAGQTYPPPYLKSELWYEVDGEGYVVRFVWLDYNDAGQLIQQTATVGDYSVNFTNGFSGFNNGTRYLFSMDMLTQDINAAREYGSRVIREDSTCENGKPCLLITLLDTFPAPWQISGEAQAFSGSGRRVWVDMETGQQVKDQSFWLVEDGSESITSTSNNVLVEEVDTPPQSVLDMLARVIVP